jgi:ankyrin repeat protein
MRISFSVCGLDVKRSVSLSIFLSLSLPFASAAPAEETPTPPLLNAARAGSVAAMKTLIDAGANVNEANVYGNTALHFALRRTSTGRIRGHIQVVALLVTRGADVNSQTRNGRTPLMDASDIGDTEVVTYLLGHGALPNPADSEGRTALAIAASRLYRDIVSELVTHGANLQASDMQGRTPLMQAISSVTLPPLASDALIAEEMERLAIVNELLAHRANANSTDKAGWTPIALAAEKGSPEIVRTLVSHGANVNARVPAVGNETPLMIAIRRNNPGTVKALLAANPDLSLVNSAGRTALSYARGYQDAEIIDLLRKAGATR